MTLDELVEESCEALIRMYSEIYYQRGTNTAYIQAHLHNINEAATLGHDFQDFNARILEKMSLTIVQLVKELDDAENR